jgi:hypothetical protein
VAFRAGFDSGGGGVFTSDPEGQIRTIDSNFGGFFSNPCINDFGVLAYLTYLEELGTQALFLSSSRTPVLETGVALFGSTLDGFVGQLAFNNAGQIAFEYRLADGRLGVARADPIDVAEPATSVLLLSAFFGGLLAAARRTRSMHHRAIKQP